jgi:hypothetical protein
LTDTVQYIRLDLGGTSYLLPADTRPLIEKRDDLVISKGNPCAWHEHEGGERWPAYCLDGDLRLARSDWAEAVFVHARPYPVGLAAAKLEQLTLAAGEVVAFRPPGPTPSAAGHLFNAAWVREREATLVFAPAALVLYLQAFGG